MARHINIYVEVPKKTPTRQSVGRDVVYPTMLEDDMPVLNRFIFNFYRGDTKRNDEDTAWILIPEWTGALEEKGTYNWSATNLGTFAYNEEDIDYKYIGNAFLVTDEQLQAEYGESAEDPWKRQSLQIVTARDADTKRWTSFANGLNIELTLLKVNDLDKPGAVVSPDRMKDGTKKGQWRFIDKSADQSDQYALNGVIIPVKYGLAISEVGTKTLCNYIAQNTPGYSSLAYGIDWLEPEGLLICPFNTLDTDNYKITREPSYDADAVDGHILPSTMKTNVDIFFVYRRWAYYARISHILKDDYVAGAGETYEFQTQAAGTNYIWGAESGDCIWTFDPTDPVNECAKYRQTCGLDPTIWESEMVDCSGSKSEGGVFMEDYYGIACCPWSSSSTYSWVGGSCQGQQELTSCPYTELGLPDLWNGGWYECATTGGCPNNCYYQCESSMNNTYKIHFPGGHFRYYGTTYLGLWWGPPPLDFSLLALSDQTKTAKYRYTTDPDDAWEYTSFDLIGDESYNDAVEHLIASGKTPEEAAQILSGYNSLHYYAPTKWAWIRVQNPLWDAETGFETRYSLHKFCSAPDGKIFTQKFVTNPNPPDPDDYLYCGIEGSTEEYIWSVISASEFGETYWRQYWWLYGGNTWVPATDSSCTEPFLNLEAGCCIRNPWKDIPYGAGLSPMQPGTLCAIIKVGGKAFYVWRKTVEEFIERYADIDGEIATKPFVTFDGPDASPIYEFWMHFSGEGRKNTHILTTKSLECHSGNEVGLSQADVYYDSENCGPGLAAYVVAGNGTVALESPVYPIFSRERALTRKWTRGVTHPQGTIFIPDYYYDEEQSPTMSSRLMRDEFSWMITIPPYEFTAAQRNKH